MSASEADAYLIDGVKSGDSDAWREIIERYEGRLLSFARRRLADSAEADDLVQETFIGLLRSLPNYDTSRSLETYLFAILRNKLNDHFRRVRSRGQRESLDHLGLSDNPDAWVAPDTPSGHIAHAEAATAQRRALVAALRAWVEQCLAQERFRELIVIEMLVVLGMRNKDIAGDLDMPETAVAGIKFRVLKRWRELTEQQAIEHDWSEADLARDSHLAKIWMDEGVSCPKRTTLGRYLLGALDADLGDFVEFHVDVHGCDRCNANLDDLRSEDERDAGARDRLRERCFASSVGFLSRRPDGEGA